MKSIPPEVYEQWDKFEDGEEDLYIVKKNSDFIEELQKIKQEIDNIQIYGENDPSTYQRFVTGNQIKQMILKIIDTHISALSGKENGDIEK